MVPGHNGVRGNEIADKLAKHGATTPFEGPEPGMGLGQSFLKSLLKNKVTEETNKYWVNLPKLRQSKLFLKQHNKHRQSFCPNLSKQNLHVVTLLALSP